LADTHGGNSGTEREQRSGQHGQQSQDGSVNQCGKLGDDDDEGLEGRRLSGSGCSSQRSTWSPSDFVWCRDGKWRPVEPGSFPLAHGVANRVGRLRAYGNAIVAPLAAEFIAAYMECRP
jgi:DNA (cytosine-5)-methyltransferase 1